jgi:hypothetical protein
VDLSSISSTKWSKPAEWNPKLRVKHILTFRIYIFLTLVEGFNVLHTAESNRRRPNFTDNEKTALVDAVVENHNTLFGKLSSTLTNAEKDEVWDQVHARVNSVSSTIRNKEELKKKYQSLKSEVK